jgi:hypothetical protein
VERKFIHGKREPRRLIVEAAPSPSQQVQVSVSCFNQALAELFTDLLSEKVRTGEFVIEEGIVKLHRKRTYDESEF